MAPAAAAVLALALSTQAVRGAGAAPPEGWRWEAYRDVRVAVPGNWGYADGGRILGGCVRPMPAVGRPEGAPACVGRPHDGWGSAFVVFQRRSSEPQALPQPGRRDVLEIGTVRLTVQGSDRLRRRVLASVRQIATGPHGCPLRDRISVAPGARPGPAADLRHLRGVTDVTACQYEVLAPDPMLVGSVRLRGIEAYDAVRAIAAAPEAGPAGEGQDRPGCASYGDRAVVLLVDATRGRTRLHLRFAGCTDNGVDDGVTRRQLVRAGTLPFLSGPATFRGWAMGPGGKAEALPERRPLRGGYQPAPEFWDGGQ